MILHCSSALVYVVSRSTVHSMARIMKSSASLGGGCMAITEGSEPFSGGRTCEIKINNYCHRGLGTNLKRALDRRVCSGDRNSLHVESMLFGTCQGKPAFTEVSIKSQ